MRRWLTVLGSVLVILAPAVARATQDDARARAAIGGLRMPLIANEGQVDAKVAFYAPTFAGTLFVTRRGELVYSLPGGGGGEPRDKREMLPRGGWTLSERMAGGRARPVGQEPSASGISYFLGSDPARWRPKVATYEGVGLGEVWPGVSVSLHARGRSIEKIFTVQPGAPVERIRVRVGGATGLAVDGAGALVASTGLGPVTFTAPVAYQEHDGVRRPVTVAYRLRGSEYGFAVGPYDRSKLLVIDPLLQSSYLGGTNIDEAHGLAIHPVSGDVYVGGSTVSANFPHTLGGPQPTHGGGYDGFVARLNGSLTAFIQATYFGGSGTDSLTGLAIHPTNGDIYVAGLTTSSNLPGTGGGAQPTSGGSKDAFVARLTPSLTGLPQATYLGGLGSDGCYGIAIHPTTGDVYVTGEADPGFPKIAGGAQTVPGGEGDAFVARLNSSLTTHLQSTYLGGSDTDTGFDITIHPTTGDIYVTGFTYSNNLPGTGGGAQPTFGGGEIDGFVARLTSSLSSLTQATYLGGSKFDDGRSIRIHPMTGDVYVMGLTESTNLPGTAGGAQPTHAGSYDTYVARLTSSLTSLTQATYLGGTGQEFTNGFGIHPITGEIYVPGQTSSTDFPGTTGGAQPTPGGAQDAFVARLTASLTSIVQATYLGGSGDDGGSGNIAFYPGTGHIVVAGETASPDFPAVAGGGQTTYGGGFRDAFVTRLTDSLAAVDGLGLSALVNQPTFTTGQTLKYSLGVINPGLPVTANFFLGTLRPDGLYEFFTPTEILVGTLSDARPILAGASLATPAGVPVPNFVSHVWSGTEPRGTYVFFFAAIASNGQLISLASASYTFP